MPGAPATAALLAHIGGVPIEESLLYVLPVIAVGLWGWRASRRAAENHDSAKSEDRSAEHADGVSSGAHTTPTP